MARVCRLTGTRRRIVNKVSHSNIKTKTVQRPNLRSKRLWLDSEKRFVRVRLTTRALRTVTKKGLDGFLLDAGLSVADIC